eukprot:876605-Rhodomonas_salina.2
MQKPCTGHPHRPSPSSIRLASVPASACPSGARSVSAVARRWVCVTERVADVRACQAPRVAERATAMSA